ncbi:MAG TPA: hypothetical protein VM677_21755 [Actinokineospora sp.]|nr:hypothetical protein [Actinokineospora sp.]
MSSEDEVLDLLLAWRADIDAVGLPAMVLVEVAWVLLCAAWPTEPTS